MTGVVPTGEELDKLLEKKYEHDIEEAYEAFEETSEAENDETFGAMGPVGK